MRLLVLLALGASGLGCGASFEPTFHGDVTFSLEERAAIERGDAWLAARIGRDPLGVVWDLPHGEPASAAPPYSIVRLRPPVGVGEYDGRLRVVLNPDAVTLEGLELLTAHELGHYRGMGHHNERGVMQEGGIRDELPVWTAADAEECRRVRLCQ